jgi:hypothetical protein
MIMIRRLSAKAATSLIRLIVRLKARDSQIVDHLILLRALRGSIGLLRLRSSGAIYTGRFIDILRVYELSDLGITCNNENNCYRELMRLLWEIVDYLNGDIARINEIYRGSNFVKRGVNSEFLRTVAHEFVHWKMLAGAPNAFWVELFSWKFRLDAMYFTHIFYKNVRLNNFVKKHLNRDFIGSEKLNIVGEGLSTEETKKLLEDNELSSQISNFARDRYALYAFHTLVGNLVILGTLAKMLKVLIEPTTWAIVEGPSYFDQNSKYYFENKEIELAKEVFELSSKIIEDKTDKGQAFNEIITRVNRALSSVDVLKELSQLAVIKDITDEREASRDVLTEGEDRQDGILELQWKIVNVFKDDSALNKTVKTIRSVAGLLPSLVLMYEREDRDMPRIGSDKLNFIAELIMSNWSVLNYVFNALFKLKAELSSSNLPSICGRVRFRDQVVGGCVNPDLNIPNIETGDVNRPFGTIEELVGNLVGTLESALVLSISDRGSVIDTVAGLTPGMSVQELQSILIDEIENNPYININDLPFITKINELSTERAGKVLESFLYFWIYTTLRLGKNSPLIYFVRHGMFFL